ncbi:RING/FYVE/PHD zinc finger superfamily protein isoform X2 [Wolffia australiana]
MAQPPIAGAPPPIAGAPPGSCQIRCAGCHWMLAVAPGMAEFVCPKCQLPQMLPAGVGGARRAAPQAQGIDPTKIQIPCARCKAVLNVPHGLARFNCPQCGVDLAVDLNKLHQFFSSGPLPFPGMTPPESLEEVDEVAVDVEREEDERGPVAETFMDYRPSKLSLGEPHPDPIVETSSLSAVQPPEPSYDLQILKQIESSKRLSCLQIETLVYACQRHNHHLPNGSRAGFFIGDGAGVGKGRTIAGLIWENWQHGRHKAVWISVGSDLKFDARRDLDDVGATAVEVHALNKLPYSKLDSKAVGIKEGVIFLTYSSLIASSDKSRTRLQQLLQWCGSEYDCLLIFDECHKAKNLIPESGSQPTRTGEAVLEIQARLPEARVIYCSATGASEPRNMGYMVRLGLWGLGTCFPKFHDFLGVLDKGGVGALELVAMDMKARGMYVCRNLSYKGTDFEVIEAPLEDKMMSMYNKAAEFWTELRAELLCASAFYSEEKSTSGQLWRLYWASHQRFFQHMCMSAKVPAVVKLAKQALIENKCAVIGLQSTGEARTEEAVSKYGIELDDFVSGPKELLLKLVEENYPLPPEPESLSGDDSDKVSRKKRRNSSPNIQSRGRTRKATKWVPADIESDEEILTDSDLVSSDSDSEFQICDVCNAEEERNKLARCSSCGQLFHLSCVVPPLSDLPPVEWVCPPCKEKTDKYLLEKQSYVADLLNRYEAAKDRKLKILEIVRSLELPNNPLDDIIDQLGGPDNVAEITGRRGMLVRASVGRGVIYQQRSSKEVTMEMVNMHEKQQFLDGKKLVAVISEAGSAGVSLHADRRAINQKRRVHITLELPWSADRAIQQFGRTHRSNQACAPEYRLIFTNLGGERRFASTVAKRLETLGALTQGDRRAGLSLSEYNYDSKHGKKALMMMYKGILEQDPLPIVPPGCSSEKPASIQEFLAKAKAALVSVGLVRDTTTGNGKDIGKGRIADSDMHDVGRFLNRLLGLPIYFQNRLFEFFSGILDLLVSNARKEGHFDFGIVDIKASIIELRGQAKTVHVDQMTGASTVLFTFTIDRGIKWEFAKSLLEEKEKDEASTANNGFYESWREWMGRRHFVLALESSSEMFKIFRPAVGEALREMPYSELKNKYRKVSSIEKAHAGWEEEYNISSGQCMHGPKCKLGAHCTVGKRVQELNVLGGLILPVWGTIEKALSKQARESYKRIRVVRVETTVDPKRVVGLLIPNAAVRTVLQDLSWVENIDE